MNYQRELEEKFAKYLISIGYPKESIIYHPTAHAVTNMLCYSPSFALIDPVNKERIAIVEVKECKIGKGKAIYQNMSDYRKALSGAKIPVYIVSSPETDEELFLLHTFDEEGKISSVSHFLFPSFEALVGEGVVERKNDLRHRSVRVSDRFQWVSLLMSFLLLTVAIADFICKEFYSITLITSDRIALLGVAVGLAIIPYLQKFKGLGVEWEKSVDSKNSY